MIISLLKRKITPPTDTIRELRLDGYTNRIGTALGVHDDIYLRLLRINDSNNSVIIGSLELLGVNKVWQDSAKSVSRNVILTATHTHSAPLICNELIISWYGPCNENEMKYLKYVNDTLVNALNMTNNYQTLKINEILLQEVDISNVCRNRNTLNGGKVLAHIIKGIDMNNEIPLLLHLPCHSTVLGASNLYITGDLAGYVTARLEETANSIVVPLIGAAGDVSTRFTRQRQDFDELKRLGDEVINSINKAKSITKIALNSLKYHELDINVPTRKKDIEEMISTMEKSQGSTENIIRPFEINAIKKMINVLPSKITVKLGALILGNNIVLIFMPFEPLYDIQELLIEDIGNKYGKYILLIGYSYDYLGYLSNKNLISYESLLTIVHFNDVYSHLVEFIKNIIGK